MTARRDLLPVWFFKTKTGYTQGSDVFDLGTEERDGID